MHEARLALEVHRRCGAHSRTTDAPCRNPAMSNGRCRMHGGKSTGRPVTHGRNTKRAISERKEAFKTLQEMRSMLARLISKA